jgi:hypothetical protein
LGSSQRRAPDIPSVFGNGFRSASSFARRGVTMHISATIILNNFSFIKNVQVMIPLVEIFVHLDDFCKIFEAHVNGFAVKTSCKKKRNKPMRMAISEITAVNHIDTDDR